MGEWVAVKVDSKPIAAVRQSRRDSWNPKRSVVAYRAWRDLVVLMARNAGLRELKSPVEMSFIFAVVGSPTADLDNWIKGIKDALVYGGILPDDTGKHVPRYKEPVEVVSLCASCKKRAPKRGGGFHKDCGSVKKCKKPFAWFRVREVEPDTKQGVVYLDNLDLMKDLTCDMVKLIESENEKQKDAIS